MQAAYCSFLHYNSIYSSQQTCLQTSRVISPLGTLTQRLEWKFLLSLCVDVNSRCFPGGEKETSVLADGSMLGVVVGGGHGWPDNCQSQRTATVTGSMCCSSSRDDCEWDGWELSGATLKLMSSAWAGATLKPLWDGQIATMNCLLKVSLSTM